MFDYHVTESGFGADIGFEKFWNVKCRLSGLRPACVSAHYFYPCLEDARWRAKGSTWYAPGSRVH